MRTPAQGSSDPSCQYCQTTGSRSPPQSCLLTVWADPHGAQGECTSPVCVCVEVGCDVCVVTVHSDTTTLGQNETF